MEQSTVKMARGHAAWQLFMMDKPDDGRWYGDAYTVGDVEGLKEALHLSPPKKPGVLKAFVGGDDERKKAEALLDSLRSHDRPYAHEDVNCKVGYAIDILGDLLGEKPDAKSLTIKINQPGPVRFDKPKRQPGIAGLFYGAHIQQWYKAQLKAWDVDTSSCDVHYQGPEGAKICTASVHVSSSTYPMVMWQEGDAAQVKFYHFGDFEDIDYFLDRKYERRDKPSWWRRWLS